MDEKKQGGSELMDKIVSLCKRRGFIFPGSEIYGGMANSWDYGPLGVELKNNIKQAWWKRFVQERGDMVGLDAALVMNPKVWEASGHLKNFTDPLVECKKCHNRFRADHIEGKTCPDCEGELTTAKQFNLMFKTFIGPAEESANVAYFRPETAQAMFVDFRQVLETSRKRIPFGIAQIGKAFRNEITPGNFIFRTREFEQMEIEYFIKENDWQKSFEYWLAEMYEWMNYLGLSKEHIHNLEVPDGERAHYSKRTVDIEYDFPFGKSELYGLAYRTDFDLKNHSNSSGVDLVYTDPESGEKYIPHVIEPTFGVDRSVLAVLVEAYCEEEAPTTKEGETETRVVLKIPKHIAPIKVAILPLSKKEELSNVAKEIYKEVSRNFFAEYDETQSIGKRYRRQDEIGTPYCVTVDFDSLEDKKVTVRDRDTMEQERIEIKELVNYLKNKF
ncbi:glycine--tRNA ligase [Candidatus Falkowbacteria bacterium RIFOXYB2_FULL_38_15]|uniref:Glycine--tRNA ligase n=1 Tax=Candidatus Falkowbacteria bacterium RIFOXYA2_FULL_38_12 TaxID=1797993 RepID=A0A1F5S1J3_9BACT|nr:MAG: glycine--tRNA ligase [Candidatus Falkowbacteria bacterium RIFOXYA2_FULL_38_12]OGF32838.1 MAG: glycine--tRNA ligase [Candidatus Falkowbacteria bacterium RIFOXYB2_FULL_38_15]OGF42298.1 MAG: glycine--tRNA ligase [Candidatus Falkowbacteria bacterium RIFOXYD2_FULL_39_16]